MTPREELVDSALRDRLVEDAKDISPKVRHFASKAISRVISELDSDDDLSAERLFTLRGEIRGVLLFMREVDLAIKSGPLDKEEGS